MMESSFIEVYDKFKLEFFRRIFELVREREGSLSAMEAFSIEVIHALHEPTVGQFADFLNISQSNATYKVNNLIKKGYLIRQNSETDRRETMCFSLTRRTTWWNVPERCTARPSVKKTFWILPDITKSAASSSRKH